MKAIIIGGVSMLALTGCTANTYTANLNRCSDVVYYAPEVPGYATLGAIAGGIGLAMLSDGDAVISLMGAGVGAAAGASAAGGLHRHQACPATSMSEVEVPLYYEK